MLEKMDNATLKFFRKKGFYFHLLQTGDRKDWWLWDVDDQKWVVATVITFDKKTFKVTLNKGNKVYRDVPIYRLFSGEKAPSDNAVARRKNMVGYDNVPIQDDNLGEQPDIKF